MRINAHFDQRAIVRAGQTDWVASPMVGVDRKMLDRIGGEVARATSLVRYAPGSRFSPHTHSGGEEFLVLAGTFSDETGDFPEGTYVRNPIGTSHQPHSDGGCVIFVKLHQFAPDDQDQKSILPTAGDFGPTDIEGVTAIGLHQHDGERVDLLRLAPGSLLPLRPDSGGTEILVIDGAVTSDGEASLSRWDWLRQPDGLTGNLVSEQGALLWRKTGHLPGNQPANFTLDDPT